MDEVLTLKEGLTWLISGGGAGILTFFIMDKVEALKNLRPDWKRYTSYGIAAVIGLLAWLASMGMSYAPVPETWQAWIETGFSIIGLALGASGLIHGATDLRKRALEERQGH